MKEAQVWGGGVCVGNRGAGGETRTKILLKKWGGGLVARSQETGWSRSQGWKSQSGGDAFIPHCQASTRCQAQRRAFNNKRTGN